MLKIKTTSEQQCSKLKQQCSKSNQWNGWNRQDDCQTSKLFISKLTHAYYHVLLHDGDNHDDHDDHDK